VLAIGGIAQSDTDTRMLHAPSRFCNHFFIRDQLFPPSGGIFVGDEVKIEIEVELLKEQSLNAGEEVETDSPQ
jgi:hypothetical protein